MRGVEDYAGMCIVLFCLQFKELFLRLEREAILDVKDIDLFCLHEMPTCHINKCLS